MPKKVEQYSKLFPGDRVFNLVLDSEHEEYTTNLPGVYSIEIPENDNPVLKKFIKDMGPKEPKKEALKEVVRRINDEFLLTEETNRKGNVNLVKILSEQPIKASCFEIAIVLQLVFQNSDIDSYLTMGTRGINQFAYHAWVEVNLNGTRYIADAANLDKSRILFEEKDHAPFSYFNLYYIVHKNEENEKKTKAKVVKRFTELLHV